MKSVATGARIASTELYFELISGASGLVLALFMWGHMILVGSILTGERGLNWLATMLEDYYIAQPTVVFIFLLFVIHAVMASRKIPAQLEERREVIKLGRALKNSSVSGPHVESMLWILNASTVL